MIKRSFLFLSRVSKPKEKWFLHLLNEFCAMFVSFENPRVSYQFGKNGFSSVYLSFLLLYIINFIENHKRINGQICDKFPLLINTSIIKLSCCKLQGVHYIR